MTVSSNVTPFPAEPQGIAPPVVAETRPFYWSVRRELWENRSLYLAPLIVAGFVLLGFLFSTMTLPRRAKAVLALSPAKQRELFTMPYNAIGGMLILTAFVIGVFYCLEALHGERRDRSILFWKSLPVSDRTTVLAKASIPLAFLPLLVYVIATATQFFMLTVNSVVLLGNGPALAALWTHVKFVQMSFALLYGLIAIALWHAPLYAWLLLISAWARRVAILWAVLPLLAIGAVEKMIFGSTNFLNWLGYRIMGWFKLAFVFPPKDTSDAASPLTHLSPGTFLSTPGLWVGLLLAALFIAAAVRLRRNREPI